MTTEELQVLGRTMKKLATELESQKIVVPSDAYEIALGLALLCDHLLQQGQRQEMSNAGSEDTTPTSIST